MVFCETGFCETRFCETGFGETGFCETGFGETGFCETGFCKTGFGETGFGKTGQNPTDQDLRRIGLACGAMQSLSCIWKSNDISNNTKTRVYETLVLSILLYNSETWFTKRSRQE